MAADVTAAPPRTSAADLGIDRAFVLGMARIPLIALLWAAAAALATAAVDQLGWHKVVAAGDQTFVFNLGPVAVICFGMLLAAFIDGYAFKVPNWVTLSLVVSGWYLGLANDLGWGLAATAPNGGGGLWASFFCTALGFALLFPALFVGGMGQGDVKMTMGFGSWLGFYFGRYDGSWSLFWSFAIGVLVGGVFATVMMITRRQGGLNWANTRAIVTDLQVMATTGVGAGKERAAARRPDWWRLPYGVPLCAGFLGYLWYAFFVLN
jgi:prepilin peptidase CpaA